MKSARRKAKGIVVSTEMILLITALIVFAVLAFYGLSKTVVQQAQSGKQTVVITRAEVTTMQEGCSWDRDAIVSVSLYVKNTGNEPVRITHIGVRMYLPNFHDLRDNFQGIDVWLQPGEARVLSRVLWIYEGCARPANPSSNFPGDPVYVAIVVDYRNEIGTTVRALNPP